LRPAMGGFGVRTEEGIWLEGCYPMFFVNVASKGFGCDVSLLFATLAGRFVSVAAKGFREEEVGT
jgi:hypothetical protein